MALVALLTATAVPLLFLFLVRTLDLYGTGSRRAIAVSFFWGAISVLIAFAFYSRAAKRIDMSSAALNVAPLLEETLKAVVLLYLVRRPGFTYFVDGAIYGFAVGIGFAVFENYLYIFQNLDAGISAALGRVLSTNLMHAGAGAIVGVALGRSRFQRFSGRVLHLFGGLLLAVLLHAAFNHLVTRSGGSALLLYAIAVGLSALAFTALTIRHGLAAEKSWIAETLGRGDRITAAEVSATAHLQSAASLLEPMAQLFGEEKAAQIEGLLRLQAQLGILRKTQVRAQQDPDAYAALSQQIQLKQQEMEDARRAIGAYTMLSLRTLFPQETDPMWQQLQGHLAADVETTAEGEERASLFTLLERRSTAKQQASQPADDNAPE